MYIAMNRFKVAMGSEADFENVWRNRDSSLSEVPGFVGVPPAAGQDECGGGLHAVFLAYPLAERGGLRELDEVRKLSRRPSQCR